MPFRYRAWPTGSARRAGVRIDGGRRGRRGDGAELISASRVDVVLARGRRRRRRRRRAGGGGGRGGAWCRRGRGVSGLVSPTARGDCAQRDDDERAGDHTRVASRRRWRHDPILSVADDRQERPAGRYWARCCAVPVQANMRRSRASAELQTPVRAHGRHIPEGISQPLQSFGWSLGVARINSCYLVGTGDADAGTGSVRAR